MRPTSQTEAAGRDGTRSQCNAVCLVQNPVASFFLIALFSCWFVAVGQPPKRAPSSHAVKGEPPVVSVNPQGLHTLELTASQREALTSFQQAHPEMDMADCRSLKYTDERCVNTYKEWSDIATFAKANVQYPFAVWGDFNLDGYLDLAVFFVSKQPAVTHKWPMGNGEFQYTYEHQWWVVVFHGTKDGTFSPVIAGRDQWAPALDGVIFEPRRRRIEYWFKSAGGSVKWTGAGYVKMPMRSSH